MKASLILSDLVVFPLAGPWLDICDGEIGSWKVGPGLRCLIVGLDCFMTCTFLLAITMIYDVRFR